MADEVKMKEFLLQYYMQRRFNSMPPEVYAKFEDYLKGNDGKGDFRGNMKDWKKKLMHEQPAGSGKFVQNDLPDPTTDPWKLSDSEWEKLYKAFRDAFRSMATQRDDFKDNDDATNFLNDNFGDSRTHPFSIASASADASQEISKLLTVLESDTSIGLLLKDALGDVSFSDFKSALRSKKYDKETKWQGILQNVARELKYLQTYEPDKFTAFQSAGIDLDKIETAFDEAHPDPRQLDIFKLRYKELLNSVTKKKINDVFKNHDGGKITGQIEAAKEKIAYDNTESKDYIPPKRDDELTPLQQMRRWAGSAWDDVLGKYFSLHGNRVYFSPAARQIVQAIDSAKIKPTDGIEKVLASSGDIKKALQYKSPTATDHFDWFTKTLTELKDTMPKAFAGALKNGRQMRAIVTEMIMMAVRQGKVDEAKTAMEVLSVIKYGYTTSKIMDAMRKEELKIFSDGGLSWNKNQGMQFVTNALDKSIKTAFLGLGYGITIVGNAYRLNGSKFNGNRGRLKGAQQEWADDNNRARADATARRDAENNADIAARVPFENDLTRLNRAGINAGNLDAKQAEVEQRTQRAETRRRNLDRAMTQPRYVNADENVRKVDGLNSELETLNNNIVSLRNDATSLQAEISALDARINNPATYAGMPPAAANAHAAMLVGEKHAKESELAAKNTEIGNEMSTFLAKSGEYRVATGQNWYNGIAASATGHGAQYSASKAILDRHEDKERRYRDYIDKTNRTQEKIDKFKDAKNALDEINTRIDKRNEEINQWDDKHKDKYKELMAYWDMLETGRDSHTGAMYKWDLLRSNKHTQKMFDKRKSNIIDANLTGYQYAA